MTLHRSDLIGMLLTDSTANTPALGTNTTAIATMAAVQAAIGATSVAALRTLRREVTDGTVTALTSDGATPTLLNRLVIPASAAWLVGFLISAVQTAGSSGTVGDNAEWVGWCAVRNLSGTVSVPRIYGLADALGSYAQAADIPPINPGGSSVNAGAAAWRVSFAVDSGNSLFLPRFTGEADKTVDVRGTFLIAGRLS